LCYNDYMNGRKRIVGLDALRLIAIVMIVIYHCFPGLLPGGFVAVEIFFVLSGFLIGQKLIRLQKKKQLGGFKGFFKFFLERLKRFLPTLTFCVILTLSLAYFADPDLLTAARPNTLSSMTFSTNIVSILRGTTYENSLIPNLFNQTWFLALEMQVCLLFYLIFASFSRLTTAKKKTFYKKFFVICLLISAVSFGLMAVYGGRFSLYDRAYFGLDSHIGAFFLGAALASFSFMRKIKSTKKKWGWRILLFISLGGVVAMTPFVHYSSPLAFIMALPVTALLGVMIIVSILKLQKRKPGRLIKVLDYLGSLSFTVYLIHFGLYILLPSFLPLEVAPYVAIALSILIAVLLQKVIVPFSAKHKVIFSILLVLSLVLPFLSLIKAPEKSSIEENLAEAKTELAEANSQVETNGQAEANSQVETATVIDYSGVRELSDLLNGDMMKAFDAAEKFAKPYPVVSRVSYGGATKSSSARAYYNTPNYGRTSELASKRVMVLGDSVVLGATSALYNTVPGVFVDAMGSRNMVDAISLLAGYRAANGGNLPRIIVIGLVTNYVNFGVGTLQAIMEAAGPGHQFVFMTGYCGDYSREAQNSTIRSVASSYANVHVGDWASIVVPNVNAYTYADHTHLTPAGRQAYANLVNKVVSGL